MAIIGKLWDSLISFSETQLKNYITKIGKGKWNAYLEWYFEALKYYQKFEVAYF